MENEYSYHIPDDGNQNYSNNNQEPNKPDQKEHKNGTGKIFRVVCAGLVFGIAASVTFQASNLVAEKVLGRNTKKVEAVGKANEDVKVNSTKLSQSTSTVTSDVSEIVENAMPSVVSITNSSVQQVQDFFRGTREYESQSSGSGIIIGKNDTELLIVSNNHVVADSDTLTVTFIDNKSVEAQIKGTNPEKDLAVVAVPLENIESDTLNQISVANLGDSQSLKVGEPVVAIGNALGYGQSVTNGIVSAKDRTLSSSGADDESAVKYIQTNAAINPGNSGGALLNANGEVIGINTAKLAANAVEGMGYAIPVSDVSDIIEDLMNRVTRSKVAEESQGVLGIRCVEVTEENAAMYNMPKGVYITEIIEGGGAEKAGISKGSIIVKFDGDPITGADSLLGRLQYYKVGETVSITVKVPGADGEYTEKAVDVTLGKK